MSKQSLRFLQTFLAFSDYLSFTNLNRNPAIDRIYQIKIFEKDMQQLWLQDSIQKNLNNHVEKVHRKKKIEKQICCPFCALVQLLIWNEVFVWISARLRFHKKIFWIDFESEISKVEVNFSVKSVRVLKCLHNFRIKQQSRWNYLI